VFFYKDPLFEGLIVNYLWLVEVQIAQMFLSREGEKLRAWCHLLGANGVSGRTLGRKHLTGKNALPGLTR